MNIRNLLWDAATPGSKRALPILSFPAAQKLGVTVETLVKSSELQAKAMEIVACETETIAAAIVIHTFGFFHFLFNASHNLIDKSRAFP